MAMAPNGQRTAHRAQPVPPGVSCSTDRLGAPGTSPATCSESTWGGQTATHQPQPVQRCGWMEGRALRGVARMKTSIVEGICARTASIHR